MSHVAAAMAPQKHHNAAKTCRRPSRRELPVRHLLHETMELRAAHVHEGAVIAALEVDVLVPLQACVDDGSEAVGGSDRGNGAVLAVRGERACFLLRGERDRPLKPAPHLLPARAYMFAPSRRYHMFMGSYRDHRLRVA